MHIIIKLSKVNEKEPSRHQEKKKVTYKGTPIKLSVDFPLETLQAMREWTYTGIFKMLRDKNFQPRIVCPENLSYRYEMTGDY